MKHSIRQRVINEYGLPVTKVETVNGELGSGIFDTNDVEIFEGDRVKCKTILGDPTHEYDGILDEFFATILFEKGCFYYVRDDSPLKRSFVNIAQAAIFEVVGNVND